MTKVRKPLTFEAAIHRIMGQMTPEAASASVGKSESLLQKASDPDVDFQISLPLAVHLDAAYVAEGHGPAPILEAYVHQLGKLVATLGGAPAHSPADPRDRLTQVMAEVGDVAAEVRAGLADGHLSAAERATIAREASEAIEALTKLIADVDGAPRLVIG